MSFECESKAIFAKAFLDDEWVTILRSTSFAHLTKTKLGFTFNAATTDFDTSESCYSTILNPSECLTLTLTCLLSALVSRVIAENPTSQPNFLAVITNDHRSDVPLPFTHRLYRTESSPIWLA